jgi:hypothetical protein
MLDVAIWGRPLWFSLAVAIASLVGIPVGTAIAVLRHDLYAWTRHSQARFTWGLVTVVLLGV